MVAGTLPPPRPLGKAMSLPYQHWIISVVIPAYNEEENIQDVVIDSIRVLQTLTSRFEILVMDDGSQDRTREILEHLAQRHPEAVRVFHHQTNQGTNLSLIELFRRAQGDLVFFLPADKQILASSLVNYLAAMEQGADVVLGWRNKRADPFYRSFFNWLYRIVLRIFYGVSFRDAAASDLYKRKVLDGIPMRSRGRLLQGEIAIRAASLGCTVREIPVSHYPRRAGRQTGIRFKTAWLSLTDLWRVGPDLKRLKSILRKRKA